MKATDISIFQARAPPRILPPSSRTEARHTLELTQTVSKDRIPKAYRPTARMGDTSERFAPLGASISILISY